MSSSTVFTNNRSQAVRLPADTRFPAGVKKVEVRVIGADRVISPADSVWDSFFFGENSEQLRATDDFIVERASQLQDTRESFD